MPAIIHERWGGLVPRLQPMALPGIGAQVAKNVDLTCGKLRPANYVAPFQRLHDDNGKMVGQLTPILDLTTITKPTAPVIAAKLRMANAVDNWVSAYAGVWATYIDPADNTAKTAAIKAATQLTPTVYGATGDGFVLRAYLPWCHYSFKPDIVYQIHGPKYQFVFSADGYYRGGPEAGSTHPANLNWSSPAWPTMSIPLAWPLSMIYYPNSYIDERYTYGYLTLIDVNGPTCVSEVYHHRVDPDTGEPAAVDVTVIEACWVDFYFRIDYVRNAEQFVHYVRTYIDQTVAKGACYETKNSGQDHVVVDGFLWDEDDIPDAGALLLDADVPANRERVTYTSWSKLTSPTRYQFELDAGTPTTKSHHDGDVVYIEDTDATEMEGPPSEIADVVGVSPGEVLQLTVTLADPYRQQKLYRSTDGGNSFGLVDGEVIAGTWYDDFVAPVISELPPYGNFPQDTVAEACEGSIIHPNQWAATIWKNELRPSDVMRLHAYPDEWAQRFPTNIMAVVLGGSNIFVFTEANATTGEQGKVFMLTGSHPSQLAMYEVANVSPLLVKTSICRVNERVFYASRDGIEALGGEGPQLVTEQLFDRPGWTNERPDLMQAWVCDRALFFIVDLTGNNNIRLDLGEKLATLTRFTRLENIQEFEWKSRPFDLGRLCALGWVQVTADAYPVVVMLYDSDGRVVAQRAVMSMAPERLPLAPLSRFWSYRVVGRSPVHRVAVATAASELLGPAVGD